MSPAGLQGDPKEISLGEKSVWLVCTDISCEIPDTPKDLNLQIAAIVR